MPDAAVVTPASGAGSTGSSSTGAGSGVSTPSTPSITFAGGDSGASTNTETQHTQSTESTPEKFAFDFGDGEKYEHTLADEPAEGQAVQEPESKGFDAKLEEALREHPDQLRQVKRYHYENQQFKANGFKSPVELKAHIDKLNGIVNGFNRQDGTKGLDAIAAEAGEWNTVYQGFKNGDPKVLEAWMTDNPEGMAKLTGPYLRKLNQDKPEVFAHEMAKVFISTLRTPDISGRTPIAAFNQLVDLYGGDPQAKPLLAFIAQQFNDIAGLADKVPDSLKQTTQVQDRPVTQGERWQLHLEKVHTRTEPLIKNAVKQAMTQALKGRKVSAEIEADIAKEIESTFNDMSKKDSDFNLNGKELLQAQDTQGFLKLMKAHLTRKMPEAARKVTRKYQGFSGAGQSDAERIRLEGQSRKESAAGGTKGTSLVRYTGPLVQGGPDPKILDRARMQASGGYQEMLMDRKFFIRNKKEMYTW